MISARPKVSSSSWACPWAWPRGRRNLSTAMPTSPEKLLSELDHLGIIYELHTHKAVYTVAESIETEKNIHACHTRNMFLRCKKKENYLITLSHNTPIDMKKLELVIGSKRLSFGSPDRLMQYLGVYPGSVTPFSAVNAKAEDIKVILEEKMMKSDYVAFHPLINTMTVVLKPEDLIRFLESCGHQPMIVNLEHAAP